MCTALPSPLFLQDIFRKYPNQYESLIPVLTESLDTLDEPEAKGTPGPTETRPFGKTRRPHDADLPTVLADPGLQHRSSGSSASTPTASTMRTSSWSS